MTILTHDQVIEIVGPMDEETLAAIIATGAKLDDIIEAKALANGKDDIVGKGEREVHGLMMEVFVILTGDRPS